MCWSQISGHGLGFGRCDNVKTFSWMSEQTRGTRTPYVPLYLTFSPCGRELDRRMGRKVQPVRELSACLMKATGCVLRRFL